MKQEEIEKHKFQGLYQIMNFLSEEESEKLVRDIDKFDWKPS